MSNASILVFDDSTGKQEIRRSWERIQAGSIISTDGGQTWGLLLSEILHPLMQLLYRSSPALVYPALHPKEMSKDTPGGRLYRFSGNYPLIPKIEEWAGSLIQRGDIPQDLSPAVFIPAGIYRLRAPDPSTWRWISVGGGPNDHPVSGSVLETEEGGRSLWRPGDVAVRAAPWDQIGNRVTREFNIGVITSAIVQEGQTIKDNTIFVSIRPFPEDLTQVSWTEFREKVGKFLALPPEKRAELAEP